MAGALAVAWCLAVAQPTKAGMATYDFESVSTGNLAPQDNWLVFLGSLTPTVVSDTTPYAASTKVLSGDGTVYRTNDGIYSFSGFVQGENTAAIEMSVKGFTANGDDASFGLGRPTGLGDTSRAGPRFGFYQNTFAIRAAAYGAETLAPSLTTLFSGYAVTHWYRLRLEMDFSSNAGNGAGTLKVMDLTLGETTWRTALSSVNLCINSMPVDSRNPSTWNSLIVGHTLSSSGARMDNVGVFVPEPAAGALLISSCAVFAVRRTRRNA